MSAIHEPLWLRVVGWTAVVWAVVSLGATLGVFVVGSLIVSAIQVVLTGWAIAARCLFDCINELMENSK